MLVRIDDRVPARAWVSDRQGDRRGVLGRPVDGGQLSLFGLEAGEALAELALRLSEPRGAVAAFMLPPKVRADEIGKGRRTDLLQDMRSAVFGRLRAFRAHFHGRHDNHVAGLGW